MLVVAAHCTAPGVSFLAIASASGHSSSWKISQEDGSLGEPFLGMVGKARSWSLPVHPATCGLNSGLSASLWEPPAPGAPGDPPVLHASNPARPHPTTNSPQHGRLNADPHGINLAQPLGSRHGGIHPAPQVTLTRPTVLNLENWDGLFIS